MIHPEIKKFFENAGYEVKKRYDEYLTIWEGIKQDQDTFSLYTIAWEYEDLSFPISYYLNDMTDYSEEEMLRLIKLMAFS